MELPAPERAAEGTPSEEIHLEMDVSPQLDTKMACIKCHQTQMAPDWPYDRVPRRGYRRHPGAGVLYPGLACGAARRNRVRRFFSRSGLRGAGSQDSP